MMIYLLSFLGIDNWWPAIVGPGIIIFIAFVLQRNFKEPDLLIKIINRYHFLIDTPSPIKDKSFIEISKYIKERHNNTFKKLPFEYYDIDDKDLIKSLIELSNVYITDIIIFRVLSCLPFALGSVILSVFLPFPIVIVIAVLVYFTIVIYDITIINESPILNKRQKAKYIILSFLLPYIYSGIMKCLYHKFRGVKILENRLLELRTS